jgi:hypothetical protein
MVRQKVMMIGSTNTLNLEEVNIMADYSDLAPIFSGAIMAGRKAGNDCKPHPMGVRYQGMDGVEHTDVIADGPCGFAQVNIYPGNSRAARYAKMHLGAFRDSYRGGVYIWIKDYNQSYERKMAHADAFASHLREHGIRASSSGRLD